MKFKTKQFPVLSPSPHLLNEEVADSLPDPRRNGRRSEDNPVEMKAVVLPPILNPPPHEEVEKAKETQTLDFEEVGGKRTYALHNHTLSLDLEQDLSKSNRSSFVNLVPLK